MMRIFYSMFMWLAQPLLRLRLRRRGRAEPGYLEAVPERFGRYARPFEAQPGRVLVWVHAVSLGETRAAAILIDSLRELLPGMRLLLTHGTATGRGEGARLLRDGDMQVWQPWDTPGAARRFLRHFAPGIGILMETEVWPNLCAACVELHVPLVLANARLSEQSLRKAQRVEAMSREAFESLAAVWAQTEADARRLRLLGAPVQAVFGNLKFDAQPDEQLLARGRAWRAAAGRAVLLFASSREGEEALFFQALRRARADDAARVGDRLAQDVQWLLVPRHPQRFDEVAALAREQGLAVSRRSQWNGAPPPADGALWLGDTLGEMALYYGMSDVALIGGSFAPLGGQNLIEAAACGCPVVMGPHTFNFTEASALAQEAGAAVRVESMADGVEAALALVVDPAAHGAACSAALAFTSAHRGAAQSTARAITALLAG